MSLSSPQYGSLSEVIRNVSASKNMETIELSVVMPCLNEELSIGECVAKCLEFFEKNDVSGEVIVADNGSEDRSAEIARSLGAQIIEVAERGYGAALRGGIDASRGRFIVIGDSDGSYDFSELLPFLSLLRSGFDVVNGNRFLGGLRPGAMPFLHRYLGNPVLSFVARFLFGGAARDYHCGLRAFTRLSFEDLKIRSNGMEFASEHLVRASLYKQRVAELPVTLSKCAVGRTSKLRTWQDGWAHLRYLLLMSPRWTFAYPGIGILILGVLLSIGVSFEILDLGRVHFGIHSLLAGVAFISLGLQVVTFGLLARYLASQCGVLPSKDSVVAFMNNFPHKLLLVVSLLAFGFGTLLVGCTVVSWMRLGFGKLEPEATMMVFIPGIGAIVIGAQLFFFCSIVAFIKEMFNGSKVDG